MTSHDVVARLRRVYRTRRIGHAGTLDPMATGVLVVLFGEATKLSSILTLHEKRYVARVHFGIGTDSLDADGKIISRRGLPDDFAGSVELDKALAAEAERTLQVPPGVSAIRIGGKRAHAMVRAGDSPSLGPREVRVHAISASWVGPFELDVELTVSKGYYVRALARDLGDHFGVPAHLSSLRRTRSGAFRMERAVPLPEAPVPLMSLSEVAEFAMKTVELTDEGALRLSQGKTLFESHLSRAAPASPGSVWVALFRGSVVGLLESGQEAGSFRVRRGIHDPGCTP